MVKVFKFVMYVLVVSHSHATQFYSLYAASQLYITHSLFIKISCAVVVSDVVCFRVPHKNWTYI